MVTLKGKNYTGYPVPALLNKKKGKKKKKKKGMGRVFKMLPKTERGFWIFHDFCCYILFFIFFNMMWHSKIQLLRHMSP
jgi:hypothetical protein